MRLTARYQHDSFGIGKGERKPLEGLLVQDYHAILRGVRVIDRIDVPCATAGQCFPNSCGIADVGNRKLNRLQHGRPHSASPFRYFFFST